MRKDGISRMLTYQTDRHLHRCLPKNIAGSLNEATLERNSLPNKFREQQKSKAAANRLFNWFSGSLALHSVLDGEKCASKKWENFPMCNLGGFFSTPTPLTFEGIYGRIVVIFELLHNSVSFSRLMKRLASQGVKTRVNSTIFGSSFHLGLSLIILGNGSTKLVRRGFAKKFLIFCPFASTSLNGN